MRQRFSIARSDQLVCRSAQRAASQNPRPAMLGGNRECCLHTGLPAEFFKFQCREHRPRLRGRRKSTLRRKWLEYWAASLSFVSQAAWNRGMRAAIRTVLDEEEEDAPFDSAMYFFIYSIIYLLIYLFPVTTTIRQINSTKSDEISAVSRFFKGKKYSFCS